jgi:hypothetical protein
VRQLCGSQHGEAAAGPSCADDEGEVAHGGCGRRSSFPNPKLVRAGEDAAHPAAGSNDAACHEREMAASMSRPTPNSCTPATKARSRVVVVATAAASSTPKPKRAGEDVVRPAEELGEVRRARKKE